MALLVLIDSYFVSIHNLLTEVDSNIAYIFSVNQENFYQLLPYFLLVVLTFLDSNTTFHYFFI